MVVLLHFEEKVHRKKLQQADHIPLLFSRLLCHVLEHMGYPIEPHFESHHHYRDYFTLDKWTQLVGYSVLVAEPPQGEEASQDEHSTDSVPHAPAPLMLEATSTVPPATSSTLEPFMTISATKFCAMVHLFQILTTTHNALFQQMETMHAHLD